MDHRFNLRIKAFLPIVLTTPDGEFSGVTSDLSFEGALVTLIGAPGPSKTAVHLHFDPDNGGVSIPAIIVRNDGTQLALMFGHYDRSVDEYLTFRLSDALDAFHGTPLRPEPISGSP